MRKNQVWSLADLTDNSKEELTKLMDELSITRVLADLLIKRQLSDSQKVKEFLEPAYENLSDPYLIPGMSEAVERIQAAITRQERIVIYGDYDADGVCSIAVLKEALDLLISGVQYYIPNRFNEGYGLNRDSLMLLREQGCQLLITVDCGIASSEEIDLANSLGMDVIVTDHHQPGPILPTSIAIVNPKLANVAENTDLAGVGVAFQLVRALARIYEQLNPLEYLDLVALATVADIVPLVGDNRILVKLGMNLLRETKRLGLKALIDISGLADKELQYWHIGYILAPRLNAAGRLAEASTAVELLFSCSEMEAQSLAEKLTILNTTRQGIESLIMDEACSEADRQVEPGDQVLVLAKEGWHQGVLGIVASRLAEGFGKPVILVSWEGEQGKGSGRAVPGFNLFKALQCSQEHLVRFGGHRLAAGISVHKSQLEDLRKALNETAAEAWEDPQEGLKITIDGVIDFQEVSTQLVKEIEKMEPFGLGNPTPLFLVRQARVVKPYRVGKKQEHLKFSLESGGKIIDAIGFGMGEFADLPFATQLYDLVVEPNINNYKGRDTLQLKVSDFKISDEPYNPHLFRNHVVSSGTDSLFEALESSIKKALNEARTVLVMYPSVRCLDKHLVGLRNIFPPGLLAPVHGCVREAERNKNIDGLKFGNKQVFLTTTSFFKSKISKIDFKSRIHGIALWSDEKILQGSSITWQTFNRDSAIPDSAPISQIDAENVGSGRRIIYTNRKTTLCKMYNWNDTVEAGIDDIGQRIRVREEYMSRDAGRHFWDGAFGGGLPRVPGEVFILGDAPFGGYEIESCLAQLVKEPSKIWAKYTQEDIEWNRRYLSQLYPDREFVLNLCQRILQQDKELIGLLNKCAANVQEEVPRGNRDLALRSGFRILSEIGILSRCKGSWQIKSVSENFFYEPEISPYFIEGLEEKKAFEHWMAQYSFKEC